jgi:MarR family transcriptional regulator for hemolysin
MIDTLEKDGLVERLPDPNDRRTKLPRVTTEGEAALRRIFAVTDPLRARLLEGLSPATIDGLNATLRDLLARLDKGLPDEEPD